MVAAVSLALLAAATVAAQEREAPAEGSVFAVTGVEYHFVGLPTSVPAGSSLSFSNGGAEYHELALGRISDGVTETLEELLAMEDPVGAGLVEIIGDTPLFAGPGEAAEGILPLEREGRYVAVCFIPQGLSDAAVLEEMMNPEFDPETASPEAQALMQSPPHMALGMLQEFTVTAAGTEPGPLPEPAEEAPAEEEPAEEAPADESAEDAPAEDSAEDPAEDSAEE